MTTYPYRLLNVFAEATFGGNPLCVFEDATGLSDQQMQALALQFNLSETVFLLPSKLASARMRIFTTGHEMAFAGHPALGTAQVVHDLLQTGDALTLECRAGVVPVSLRDGVWTFSPPNAGAPQVMSCELSPAQVAALLGLAEHDLAAEPLWVNTGSDQLLVPLKTAEAVRRAQPDSAALAYWPANSLGRKTAYVFAPDGAAPAAGERLPLLARYFFAKVGGGVAEDPGTGSACANLGGWWLHSGRRLPASLLISQGEQVQRPSQLYLDIGADSRIRVGGRVLEIGRGVIQI
ncbi:MAG: PhzF family phenazine biosynthesis protein [Burkholderiales bacterium]|nr:PhzF family phenazine biosynthesis protein [Burkholderiales bacterium]